MITERNALSCHGHTGRSRRFSLQGNRVDVWAGYYPAVILHPSLGCPLIVEDASEVSLFIIAGAEFREALLAGNGHDGEIGAVAGDNLHKIIRQHLKIHRWKTVDENLKELSKLDQPLGEVDWRDVEIGCRYLGKLGEELRNDQGRHFANLRPETRNQFGVMGFHELFEIHIGGYPFEENTLYDAFWAVIDKSSASMTSKGSYLDYSDLRVQQYITKTWRNVRGHNQEDDSGASPGYAFAVDEKDGLTFVPDPAIPLQCHHPIFVPAAGKESLNLGHLSDVHVSSRQSAYKDKKAQVIPGVDESASPPIGAMANNNADNFFDLLVQFGDDPDVDILVITGDLYDHLHNFDPRSRDTSTMGKLWEALYVDSVKAIEERSAEYPYGIDGLAVYSLLVYFYSRFQKPVLMISGNHEAYEYPYGISPRVTGVGRVNEGIPLDHNLTFYEAILLYGPGYDKAIPSLIKDRRFNFKASNFDWFSTVFAPLSDFALTYKNQCLIGLEWGQAESFVRSSARGGGTLPRADKALSSAQHSLVQDALSQDKNSVLCTHFTLINYCTSKPLREHGEFDINSIILSSYDQGSSQKGRPILYEQFLRHSALKLTLSGHSHRAGLYTGDLVQEGIQTKIKCRGYHPETDSATILNENDGVQIFVTASTGPISKQNLSGEMSGQGMEVPSAGKIVFNADTPRISLVKSRCPAAKPRFAVACDYIDVLQGGFWEYFKAVDNNGTFEMKVCWEKIHPEFPPAKKADFIESVTLWMVGDEDTQKCESQISFSHQRETVNVNFGRRLMLRLEEGYSNPAFFLSLKFKNLPLQNSSGFRDYDYESSWSLQVGIYDQRRRDITNTNGNWLDRKPATNPFTWQIMRHKDYGEVPNLDWRAQILPLDFKFNI